VGRRILLPAGKTAPPEPARFWPRDPGSGKEEKKFDDIPAYWFHHRCYPAKATEDYLIMSRTGTEFVDLKTGEWTLHHWVRGACLYGIMPANGCCMRRNIPAPVYIGAKMYGFTALAPAQLVTASATTDSRRPTVDPSWQCRVDVPRNSSPGTGRMAHVSE